MNWTGKEVLVTGGAGAIGSNLVRALLDAGARVVVLDDMSSGRRENLPADPNPSTSSGHRLEFVLGSVTDENALESCFAEGVDVLFHLAALFANQNSVEHPVQDLQTNGLGTLQVLERCRQHGVERVVYGSSSCVYLPGNGTLTEDSPVAASATPYAITKLLGEQYVKFYTAYHGLAATILRYFNTYGPGELPGPYRNVIPNFIARALRGEPLVITGTGDETRDFTYVGDVVQGTLLAATRQEAIGQTFNIASGVETCIRDLAGMINEQTGNSAGIAYAPRRAWDRTQCRRASITRAQQLLGYKPMISLEQGLRTTVEWLRAELRDLHSNETHGPQQRELKYLEVERLKP